MEDRSIQIGLVLFFIALLLIGMPATMPFSRVNTAVGDSTIYELTRQNTSTVSAPEKIVAFRHLEPKTQQFIVHAIEQNESREPVMNISVGEEGLPLGERDQPAIVGVQYDGKYYEFQARLTTASTQADIIQMHDWLKQVFVQIGLLIAVVGFVYYTEFGRPHSYVPAILLGSFGLWVWLLVYVAPFQDFTTQAVSFVYMAELVGVSLFVGVSSWRYFNFSSHSPNIEDS